MQLITMKYFIQKLLFMSIRDRAYNLDQSIAEDGRTKVHTKTNATPDSKGQPQKFYAKRATPTIRSACLLSGP